MKKLFPFVMIALVAWLAYGKYEAQRDRDELAQAPAETQEEQQDALVHTENLLPERSEAGPACDGRTHCSQMTSCKEAKYFINHCPGTKMDGDNDGVPCEQQWCN